jgi:hypothetical protein
MEVGAAADADEHAQRAARHEVRLVGPHHIHESVVVLQIQVDGPGLFWAAWPISFCRVVHRRCRNGFDVSQTALTGDAKSDDEALNGDQ